MTEIGMVSSDFKDLLNEEAARMSVNDFIAALTVGRLVDVARIAPCVINGVRTLAVGIAVPTPGRPGMFTFHPKLVALNQGLDGVVKADPSLKGAVDYSGFQSLN